MGRPMIVNGDGVLTVKEIMLDKGISLDEFAKALGKTRSTLSNQLRMENMSVTTLRAMAAALDVEVADLFRVPIGYKHYCERRREEVQQAIKNLPQGDMELFRRFQEFLRQEEALARVGAPMMEGTAEGATDDVV